MFSDVTHLNNGCRAAFCAERVVKWKKKVALCDRLVLYVFVAPAMVEGCWEFNTTFNGVMLKDVQTGIEKLSSNVLEDLPRFVMEALQLL